MKNRINFGKLNNILQKSLFINFNINIEYFLFEYYGTKCEFLIRLLYVLFSYLFENM